MMFCFGSDKAWQGRCRTCSRCACSPRGRSASFRRACRWSWPRRRPPAAPLPPGRSATADGGRRRGSAAATPRRCTVSWVCGRSSSYALLLNQGFHGGGRAVQGVGEPGGQLEVAVAQGCPGGHRHVLHASVVSGDQHEDLTVTVLAVEAQACPVVGAHAVGLDNLPEEALLTGGRRIGTVSGVRVLDQEGAVPFLEVVDVHAFEKGLYRVQSLPTNTRPSLISAQL